MCNNQFHQQFCLWNIVEYNIIFISIKFSLFVTDLTMLSMPWRRHTARYSLVQRSSSNLTKDSVSTYTYYFFWWGGGGAKSFLNVYWSLKHVYTQSPPPPPPPTHTTNHGGSGYVGGGGGVKQILRKFPWVLVCGSNIMSGPHNNMYVMTK